MKQTLTQRIEAIEKRLYDKCKGWHMFTMGASKCDRCGIENPSYTAMRSTGKSFFDYSPEEKKKIMDKANEESSKEMKEFIRSRGEVKSDNESKFGIKPQEDVRSIVFNSNPKEQNDFVDKFTKEMDKKCVDVADPHEAEHYPDGSVFCVECGKWICKPDKPQKDVRDKVANAIIEFYFINCKPEKRPEFKKLDEAENWNNRRNFETKNLVNRTVSEILAIVKGE